MIQLANQIDRDVLVALQGRLQLGRHARHLDRVVRRHGARAERFDLSAVPQDGRASRSSPRPMVGRSPVRRPPSTCRRWRRRPIARARSARSPGSPRSEPERPDPHRSAPRGGTPLVNGASQNVAYTARRTPRLVPGSQSLITDGWTAAASRVKQGDVFTIANVYAVNPVTKATCCPTCSSSSLADGSSDGSGNLTLSIAPAIITSGAFQTVSAPGRQRRSDLPRHGLGRRRVRTSRSRRNAFALCVVPMESRRARSTRPASPTRASASA
jgi:hypothetical protein